MHNCWLAFALTMLHIEILLHVEYQPACFLCQKRHIFTHFNALFWYDLNRICFLESRSSTFSELIVSEFSSLQITKLTERKILLVRMERQLDSAKKTFLGKSWLVKVSELKSSPKHTKPVVLALVCQLRIWLGSIMIAEAALVVNLKILQVSGWCVTARSLSFMQS